MRMYWLKVITGIKIFLEIGKKFVLLQTQIKV